MGALWDKETSQSQGSTSTSQTDQSSTTINEMLQQGQFENLLGSADDWFASGGLGQQSNLSNAMAAILAQSGGYYSDVLSGKQDEKALQNILALQGDAAQQTFERNVMPALASQSIGAGTGNSSRRGIAEGLAASDMQSQLAQQQQATIYDYQNQANANKANAANALANQMGQIGALQENMNANTAGAQQLQNLLAFKELISGNMGGTTSTESSSTTNQSGNSWGSTTQGGSTGGDIMQTVGGIASIVGMFSDESLKSNIKPVKGKNGKDMKTPIGATLYSWTWNSKAKKFGLTGTAEGVMAEDVQKLDPSAVTKNKDGLLVVDYGKVFAKANPKPIRMRAK